MTGAIGGLAPLFVTASGDASLPDELRSTAPYGPLVTQERQLPAAAGGIADDNRRSS